MVACGPLNNVQKPCIQVNTVGVGQHSTATRDQSTVITAALTDCTEGKPPAGQI